MRPASLRPFVTFLSSIGLASYVFAGPIPVSPRDPGSAGAPASSNFGSQSAPTNTSPDSTSDSQSNSGSSSSQDDQHDIASAGADGLPILKRKPGAEREKIIELKDGQKLPTSGVDPKFQGSLLNTSVGSIASITPKTNKDAGATKQDLLLKTTNLNLTKDSADSPKKSEPIHSRSNENSSPTPTPSATASPTTKASSDRKP